MPGTLLRFAGCGQDPFFVVLGRVRRGLDERVPADLPP